MGLCGAVGRFGNRERADPHAEQPDPPIEGHALQAFARGAADRARVLGRRGDGLVARHGVEVVVAKLEPDRLARVALALKIVGNADAKLGEDLA